MIIRKIRNHIFILKKRKNILKKFPTSNVDISCIFNDKTFLEGYNNIAQNSNISSSQIGIGTYLGPGDILYHCKIGRYCSISNNVIVNAATHPTNLVSTNPIFYNTCNTMLLGKGTYKFNEFIKTSDDSFVIIGNDVWIGSNVIIRGGVKIGDGAIIGMGAVVTRDVPPYAVVAGVPAKIIRYRFDNQTIQKLLCVKWWEWPVETIKNNRDDFCNLKLFIKKYYVHNKKL